MFGIRQIDRSSDSFSFSLRRHRKHRSSFYQQRTSVQDSICRYWHSDGYRPPNRVL